MTKRGKRRTGIQVGCLAVAGMATAVIMATEPAYAEAGEEQTACREMIEGYYGGDASGLDDILAETFAKQGVIDRPAPENTATVLMNKQEFIAAVASGNGKLPEDQWDITVETMDLSAFLATVKVTSVYLIDVCQLGKVDGRWRIFNVIWTLREESA